MNVPFSEKPGRHERHLRRRLGNPLFPQPADPADELALLEAQRLDHEELVAFVAELRDAVQAAVQLRPQEDSDVILALKERLDKLYERACGLAEDQSANKAALRRLVDVILRTVRTSAGPDPLAQAELDQEDEARAAHHALLEQAIVADLLDPASPIAPDELAAALLVETAEGLDAALQLFDATQLELLCAEARRLLDERDPDRRLAPASARLDEMESRLAELLPRRH
jgi:hypothetical protein